MSRDGIDSVDVAIITVAIVLLAALAPWTGIPQRILGSAGDVFMAVLDRFVRHE